MGDGRGRRTVSIKVRLSPEELDWLKAQADADSSFQFRDGKTNYSAYYRERLLSTDGGRERKMLAERKRLAYEMRKIGVNINQAARKINAGYGDPTDIAWMIEKLEEVEGLLKKDMERWEAGWQ